MRSSGFGFFHVHGADRESQEVYNDIVIPWVLKAGAPLFTFLADMLRRLFKSPLSWKAMWAFVKKMMGSGRYKLVREGEAEFRQAYQDCLTAGNGHRGSNREVVANEEPQRKDAAFGVGSHTLIYPGATSYEESAWLYCLELEGISMTVQGFFQNQVRYGRYDINSFADGLLKLFQSSYAYGVSDYHCKHAHTSILGAIIALKKSYLELLSTISAKTLVTLACLAQPFWTCLRN